MKRRNTVPTPTAKPFVQSTEALEKAVRNLHKPAEHSYNFRIPMDLYEEIEAHLEKSGQTLKNFLVFSAREYLKNQR